MATKKQLDEMQDIASKALRDQRYAEGRNTELREELDDYKEKNNRKWDVMQRNHEELQSQMDWMRQLVELICVPKDKMEELHKLRQEITSNGRMY